VTMRLKPDTLRDEIVQVIAILDRWKSRLEEGVPGDEIPANEMNAEIFQYQLRGEIYLAAERLMALAEVIES